MKTILERKEELLSSLIYLINRYMNRPARKICSRYASPEAK